MKVEHQRARVGPDRIGPDDPRYSALIGRGFNKRFAGKPDYVRLVQSTDEVIDAVQDAVHEGRRVVARGGGHCLEGFVDDPDVRVIIDTSLMTGVRYDPGMGAFEIDAGTTLGEAYRRLYLGWGLTIPAGESPYLGLGAHVSGGAFGFLCRQHGLAADHLYGLEVVVVDADGTARSVVATRDPSDPNRDLWWAHTGAGGGNFGIVTRCWFRSPGATGNDPTLLLPKAPESILVFRVAWNWDDMDAASFSRLATNFGDWCEVNSDASSRFARLFSTLFLWRRQLGKLEMKGLSTAGVEADRLVDEHIAAITSGIGAPHTRSLERSSWLNFALNPFPELFAPVSNGALVKGKDAFLRKRFTDGQIGIAHQYLTRTDCDVAGGMLGLATYGGQVNNVAPEATASAQRDSILTTSCSAGWGNPNDESRTMAWVRAFYRDLFADTGGVPVPGGICDGAMINHPDVDLADPDWNTSGVAWHTLYFKNNYAELQRIKRRWDPRNVFHHALSIRP
jgi:aclacinomycin oxidase